MTSKILLAAAAFAVALPASLPTAALSKERVYKGERREYRERCKRTKGTAGLLAGAGGGALVGNTIIGGPVATIAGGVGGALLGKHIDKRTNAARNRRRGC